MHPVLHKARKLCGRAKMAYANRRSFKLCAADAPLVLTDSSGFRFTFHPWMRPYAKNLVDRATTSGQWAAIAALVGRDDVVFDVGAHAGRFSAFVEKLLGPRGVIYAFEPVPDTYWMLRENLVLNRCTKVIAAQSAISDLEGSVTMNLFPPEFSSWNTMGKPVMKTPAGGRVSPRESVDVPSDTLDAFTEREGIERIDLLKVDVEGFETAVFRGAARLLSERRIGRICFEISADPLKGANATPRDVFAELERHGYGVYEFDDAQRLFTGPIHDSNEFWANYYASVEPLAEAAAIRQALAA